MRLVDADALVSKCGDYYVEEGPEDGFIGTLKTLVDMQPTVATDTNVLGKWVSVKDAEGDDRNGQLYRPDGDEVRSPDRSGHCREE